MFNDKHDTSYFKPCIDLLDNYKKRRVQKRFVKTKTGFLNQNICFYGFKFARRLYLTYDPVVSSVYMYL